MLIIAAIATAFAPAASNIFRIISAGGRSAPATSPAVNNVEIRQFASK